MVSNSMTPVQRGDPGTKTLVRVGLCTGFVVGLFAYLADHALRDFSLTRLLITVLLTTVLGVPAVVCVESFRRFLRNRNRRSGS